MEMSLKYCLAALIIVVQSAVALSKELDYIFPVTYLLSNESSGNNESNVVMSSGYYDYRYYNGVDDTAVIIVLIIWGVFVGFSLLLGCIMLLVCKPRRTPGFIIRTNREEQGVEAKSSSSLMSGSQNQPPPYHAIQHGQTLYPPVAPVMRPQQSGYTVEFQNPISGNVKPGRIISSNKVVENQPKPTYVRQHFPESQPPNPYHPASQQLYINAETPSVMGTQTAETTTEFNNPITNS